MAATARWLSPQSISIGLSYIGQDTEGSLRRSREDCSQQHALHRSLLDWNSRLTTRLSLTQNIFSRSLSSGKRNPRNSVGSNSQGPLWNSEPSNVGAVNKQKQLDGLLKLRRKKRQPIKCQAAGRQDPGSNLTPALELEPSVKGAKQPVNNFNGIFLLLILNIGIYVLDHVLRLPVARSLYLNHMRPEWWQFVTSTFCHFNWNHLSSNLFFLYIFGKLVEEEEGSLGVWASYLITGLGANVVSFFLLPHSNGGAAVASCGASGAVFGLFAISVLVKLSWNWRKILEVLILGQFVVEKVIAEAAMSARGTQGLLSGGINHVAHLAGALVGVALILFITRLPEVAAGGKDPGRLE